MRKPAFRKTLSAPGLLRIVRERFDRIQDPVAGRGLTLTDCLMSGLAVFGLKYASLPRFDLDARVEGTIRSNLSGLYGVGRAPSDTRLRERLDEVDPGALRPAFKAVFAAVRRGKGLEGFECLGRHFLLSVDGTVHRFRYLDRAPLNDANFELEVNFLEYWETRPDGTKRHFSWVTDLPVDESNLFDLMRAGRARWRIENETFNTPENQGYGFGHNFGHLATVFAFLMMLAFPVDQAQQRCCALFRAAKAKAGRALYFWDRLRRLFLEFSVRDWGTLYKAIAFGHRRAGARQDGQAG